MSRRLIVADAVRDASGVRGDAILVDGPRIAAVGSVERLRSPDLREDRYPGGVVVPGLRDAHLHPVGYAAALSRPSLKTATDFSAIADALADAAARQPGGSAVVALRLDDESLAEGRLPARDFIDRVVPDRPVVLTRYCGHVMVANSAALALAGVDESTPDPPRGSMDRDHRGRLTGVLRETATDLVAGVVQRLAPPITPGEVIDASVALAATGLTGVGAIVSTEAACWAGAGCELDTLIETARELAVTMKVMVIADDPTDLETAAARLAQAGGRLRFTGVKIFSDGSLGGHTAALHEGYADLPEERGIDRLDIDWATTLSRAALRLGGRVAIHAIGDRANGGVLDLMETLIREGADPAMLRVEHASVLTEADIVRFGRLGVTASVQPVFMASETTWLHKRLGVDRLQRTYAFRSLADAGVPLAGGSDSPVEPPHPLPNMAAARDRCGIVPTQALTAQEALSLFTDGAARAIGEEAALVPGAPASLTILDADPVEAAPDRVRATAVLATWVEGASVAVPPAVITWQS
jgi:predicted amidohydrolase YtcJ